VVVRHGGGGVEQHEALHERLQQLYATRHHSLVRGTKGMIYMHIIYIYIYIDMMIIRSNDSI
jgi:hypothetical protein